MNSILHKIRSLVTEKIETALEFSFHLSWNHSIKVVIFVFIFMAISLLGAKKLVIRSSLTELLPENFESVKNIKKLEKIYGGVGQLLIIIETKNPQKGEKFVLAAIKQLNKNKKIRYIQHKKPIYYLSPYKFLFMDYQDLQKIYQRARKKIEYEKQKNNPLALDLEEIRDPGFNISDIKNKYKNLLQKTSINSSSAYKNNEFYWNRDEEDSSIYRFVILVKPNKSFTDIKYTYSLIESIKSQLDSLNPKSYDPTLKFVFSGKYQKNLENLERIKSELGKTSIIAFLLIFFSIAFYFRRIRAIIYIFVPLFIGILFTFGITGFTLGYLNLITSFLIAILLGVGIDHGIHIYSRYIEERIAGFSQEQALKTTIMETGMASTIAGITTSVAFLGLMPSQFRAFSDFGFIAGLGVLLCLFSIILLFPILVKFYERWRPFPKIDVLVTEVTESPLLAKMVSSRWLWLIIPITIFLIFGLVKVRFSYDLKKLETSNLPSYILEDKVRDIFSLSFTPTVLIPERKSDLKKITDEINRSLKKMKKKGLKPTIETAKSISSLIPENQNEKIKILKKIRKLLQKNRKHFNKLNKEMRQFIRIYQKDLTPGKLTPENLPQELSQPFKGVGQYKDINLVLLFPNISLSDGIKVQKMQAELTAFQEEIGGFEYASDAFILADIIKLIQTDGVLILIFTFLAVFCIIQVGLDSIRQSFIVMTPLVLGMIWMVGIMGWIDLQFNILNIIILPIVVGIGIDNGVHFFHRFKEKKLYSPLYALRHAGKPLTMTTLTTVIGFSSLIFADHFGIYSMGLAIVIGILCVYISAMWVVPVLLSAFAKKNKK